MRPNKTLYANINVDCEVTQPAINNPVLGERSTRGLASCLERHGWHGTFFVIPTDIEIHARLYLKLREKGHEVGLHLHPASQGYAEFCGVYDAQAQEEIIGKATERFMHVMGFRPQAFSMGYASANDYTYPVLVKLGFRHGRCSIPGRILPECASVWAGAPLFIHYVHPNNRILEGDLDFVEIPSTTDWESRVWGGKHPVDLRIELLDAKDHYYTIEKSLRRQIVEKVPLLCISSTTHNIFDYGNVKDFRHQTLQKVIGHIRTLAQAHGLTLEGITLEEIAARFRSMARPKTTELKLDRH